MTTTCQGIGRIETCFACTQPVRPFGRPGTAILYQVATVLLAAWVTLPEAGKGLQPLCAVYRRDFREVAERALSKKKNKIDRLFADVETRVIAEPEIARMGFPVEMFQNLNTPEEFAKAERLFDQSRS